jgi:hypothetical protein
MVYRIFLHCFISLHCPILTQILHTVFALQLQMHMPFLCLLMWHWNVKHLESYALRFISKAPPTGKYDVVLFIHSDLLRTGGFGVRTPVRARFSAPSRPALRPTQSPAQWVRGLFPGIKLPGRGVDYHPNICPRLGMDRVTQRPLRASRDMLRGDLYLLSSFRCSVCRALVCPDRWLYFAYVCLVVNHLI